MRKSKLTYNIHNGSSYPIINFDGDEYCFPDFVYKYYSLNERNVSAVISHKCFVSVPDQLNDLFDTLFLRIKVTDSQLETYKVLAENVGQKINEKEFKNSPAYRDILRNTIFAIWNSKIGILSTSDDPLNDLMWAHYTNNEGFLLQLDYKQFPENFSQPIPVSYLSDEEFTKLKIRDLETQLFENTLIKKRIWIYENEFRFLVFPKKYNSFHTTGMFSNEDHAYPKESRLQEYPIKSIKIILLGFNFFKNLLTENRKIDFARPTGLLKKCLLDWINQNEISVEIVSLDYKKMHLLTRKFNLKQITELEYEIEYAC